MPEEGGAPFLHSRTPMLKIYRFTDMHPQVDGRQAYIGGRGVKDQSDWCKEGIGPDEVLVLERDVEGTVGARFMLPRSAEPSS